MANTFKTTKTQFLTPWKIRTIIHRDYENPVFHLLGGYRNQHWTTLPKTFSQVAI